MGFLGLGVGRINLRVDERDVEPGELLTGWVELRLKEEVEAKGLVLRLRCTQRRKEKRVREGRSHTVTTTDVIYESELELEGPGLFEHGDFEFEIAVPSRVDVPEKLAGVADLARALSDIFRGPLLWSLEARLVVDFWKFDVKKAVDINVHG